MKTLLSSVLLVGLVATSDVALSQAPLAIDPSALPVIGSVSPRFQSYNIEMLEVTGGKFWKPYREVAQSNAGAQAATPVGTTPSAYSYRPPIDLSNGRRIRLAAALGPVYMRVSGTWANTTYFAPDGPAPAAAPDGFGGVLTRDEWKGVVIFSKAVDAEIVTSFSTGAGVRDARGLWTSGQAASFLEYTKAIGGNIAAAEFMNEPDLAVMGGAPKGYTSENYARDYRLFAAFARAQAPNMMLLAPGSVAESNMNIGPSGAKFPIMHVTDLFGAADMPIDAYDYHFYPAVSKRLAAMAPQMQVSPEAELTEAQLSKTDAALAFYRTKRDATEPGKPLWITETAEAAGGGNPWASTFLDSFRYLDQLGRLAKGGVQVILHNTLDASDYGLLDENTLLPRPDYWAALLWHDLMGTSVLESGVPIQDGLHVYAQSLKGSRGGVAVLVINTSKSQGRSITFAKPSARYTLSTTADGLQDTHVLLNGHILALAEDDSLPARNPVSQATGPSSFDPATITFLTFADAGNPGAQ
jgi:heparanase 1